MLTEHTYPKKEIIPGFTPVQASFFSNHFMNQNGSFSSTVIPYRVFPVKFSHTGKNLFLLHGTPAMKTGFSL